MALIEAIRQEAIQRFLATDDPFEEDGEVWPNTFNNLLPSLVHNHVQSRAQARAVILELIDANLFTTDFSVIGLYHDPNEPWVGLARSIVSRVVADELEEGTRFRNECLRRNRAFDPHR